MDPYIDLQNFVQSPSQGRSLTNPSLGSPSLATPISPRVPGTSHQPPSACDNDDIVAEAQRRQRKRELHALSRTFEHIPNIPIFTRWDTRKGCSEAAVHRSPMAGICGNARDGVYSVVLSVSYKDDEDGGDVIIYTGTGGRERWTNTFPPKRLRIGPQTKDQSWDHPSNKALIVSSHTGNPLRVVRSWRCPSKYAPMRGYRYDGLYRVAAYWTAKGSNGLNICRCRLERLPDQPPIPLRPVTLSTSRKRNRGRLVSCSGGPPAGTDSGLEADLDLGVNQHTQPLLSRHGITPNPKSLSRYRWDPKKQELVKIPASRLSTEGVDAAGGNGGECRDEDDALTLVPSEDEDGHVGVMPANDSETEYFSDGGNSPQLGTLGLDEPHASVSEV